MQVFPAHNAVAKAIEKRPQSSAPACICTLMYLILNDGSEHFRIAATCLMRVGELEAGILPYIHVYVANSRCTVLIRHTHPMVSTDMHYLSVG